MEIDALQVRVTAGYSESLEEHRYTANIPARRSAALLRREVYRRETQAHAGEPAVLRMAHCLGAYLLEKEIIFEDERLAGFYLFAGNAFSSPVNTAEEVLFAYRELPGVETQACQDLSELVKYTEQGMCTRAPAGHVIAGYEKVLAVGIGGLIAETEAAIVEKGETPFRRAALIVCQAASIFIRRYGAKAADLAQGSTGGIQSNYLRVARACDWIAERPPRDFFEAVQLVCLVHEIIITEQRSGSLSLGRFDHYLAPFYERDKLAGRIDPQSAAQIVEAFFLKLASVRRSFQNLTVGGYDTSAGCCYSDLTQIILRACRKLHKDQPLLTLRWHPGMPADLWEDILDLITSGIGFPALFNDAVCIEAKRRAGISEEDAEQYAIVGCVELSAGGKEYAHTEGLRVSWLKVLELMLNGGRCMVSGEEFTLAEPRPLETVVDFADFYAWYRRELGYVTQTAIRAANILDGNYHNHWPSPFLSATMDRCIESGLDATAGGTRYNNSAINAAGMANTIDSLLAIRKFVFEERRFSLAELSALLRENFANMEATRLSIINGCPRFGSDAQAAEMMADMAAYFHSIVREFDNPRGGRWELGFYTVDSHGWLGERTGASPDGRRQGYALANAMSPVQGTEKSGPTEVLQEVAMTNNTFFGNGMVLDIKFHPRFFQPPAHRKAFRSMVETYFDMGGMEIQFNVIDRQTLINARLHPEQYRDLLVRVSGFSAYFTSLRETVQDEIIDRTEF
jgi:formate C-acetyltransferase